MDINEFNLTGFSTLNYNNSSNFNSKSILVPSNGDEMNLTPYRTEVIN